MNTTITTEEPLVEEYERQALILFRAWYREEKRTIEQAAGYTKIAARQVVEEAKLIPTKALLLLYQNREWVSRACQGNSITELVEEHLAQHLEEFLQKRGIFIPSNLER